MVRDLSELKLACLSFLLVSHICHQTTVILAAKAALFIYKITMFSQSVYIITYEQELKRNAKFKNGGNQQAALMAHNVFPMSCPDIGHKKYQK